MSIPKDIEKLVKLLVRLAVNPIPCLVVAFAWWYTRLNGAIALGWFLSSSPPASLAVATKPTRWEYFYFLLLFLSPLVSLANRKKRHEYIEMQELGREIKRDATSMFPRESRPGAPTAEKTARTQAVKSAYAAGSEGLKLTQEATKRLREMM